jgi:hypothetical protein
MLFLSDIKHAALRFWYGQKGAIAVEAILVFPILAWAYMASFVYFDASRTKNTNLKTAYTIADALSREASVNQNYINTMHDLLGYLSFSKHETRARITIVRYSSASSKYTVSWSEALGNEIAPWTDNNINSISSQLPTVPENDPFIVVETFMDYTPSFNVGLDPFTINYLVVTRPRYFPGICWDGTTAC